MYVCMYYNAPVCYCGFGFNESCSAWLVTWHDPGQHGKQQTFSGIVRRVLCGLFFMLIFLYIFGLCMSLMHTQRNSTYTYIPICIHIYVLLCTVSAERKWNAKICMQDKEEHSKWNGHEMHEWINPKKSQRQPPATGARVSSQSWPGMRCSLGGTFFCVTFACGRCCPAIWAVSMLIFVFSSVLLCPSWVSHDFVTKCVAYPEKYICFMSLVSTFQSYNHETLLSTLFLL